MRGPVVSITARLQAAFSLFQSGQLEAADKACRAIVKDAPATGDAHHLLGIMAFRAGRLDDAAAHVRRAVKADPRQAEFLNTLGAIVRASGDVPGAIVHFEAALRLRPNHAQAMANLGNALAQVGQFEEAAKRFRQALELAPNAPGVLNNLGNVLRELGETDAAIDSFEAALRLNPNYPEALANMGVALMSAERFEEAVAVYRRALAIDPVHAAALVNIGNALLVTGAHPEALGHYAKALERGADFPLIHYNIAALQNYRDDVTAVEKRRLAEVFGARLAAGPVAAHHNGRDSDRRLRVGLVSGDLRNHAVARFLLPLIVNHDPSEIEFVAYSTSRLEDSITAELRSRTVLWRSLLGLSATDAAALIRGDAIDVLVDLAGYTDGARLDVFAQKPAPIQFGWLGYSGTTGVPGMDYIMADPWVAPGGSEGEFSEAVWRLPDSYLCFGTPDWTEPGPLPARRNGYVTFGSFNNIGKLGPGTIACWTEVLRAVPDSRLVIKSSRGGVQKRLDEILATFVAAGIDPDRLRLIDRLKDSDAHLALYGEIDIGLDPFPYNGTTTTCEALWMGVPVLTKRGDSFVSRVGESLMQSLDLQDWIAADLNDYVSRAGAVAADLAALADLRSSLRSRFRESPLGDGPRFARNFEAALRQMWRQWCVAQGQANLNA